LAELGIVSAKGRNGTGELLRIIADGADSRVSAAVRGILDVLAHQYSAIGTEIVSIEEHHSPAPRVCGEPTAAEIPGIGQVGATAMVAEIGDWKTFFSGRSLAAWIGLVPKQHTTGGKDRLGSITKQGDRYLRWLLVVGAMAVIRYARKHGTHKRPWLARLMERRPTKVAAVALANKIARMACAIMSGARDIRSRNCCRRHESRQQIDRQHQLARARRRNADTVVLGIGRTRLGQRTSSKVRVFVSDPIRAEH
jgi:transposase